MLAPYRCQNIYSTSSSCVPDVQRQDEGHNAHTQETGCTCKLWEKKKLGPPLNLTPLRLRRFYLRVMGFFTSKKYPFFMRHLAAKAVPRMTKTKESSCQTPGQSEKPGSQATDHNVQHQLTACDVVSMNARSCNDRKRCA